MKHKCGICKGSGKVPKVEYRLPNNLIHHQYPPNNYTDNPEMNVIGEKDCPGCDGSGVSIAAKIKNGEMEAPKEIDLEGVCKEVLKEKTKEVKMYKEGKTKVIGSMIGAVLKKESRADPREANEMLRSLLEVS